MPHLGVLDIIGWVVVLGVIVVIASGNWALAFAGGVLSGVLFVLGKRRRRKTTVERP